MKNRKTVIGGMKMKTNRCGVVYPTDALPPKHARYALIFWSYVVFATSLTAIEEYRGKLGYYEQEDSRIELLR